MDGGYQLKRPEHSSSIKRSRLDGDYDYDYDYEYKVSILFILSSCLKMSCRRAIDDVAER